MGRLSYGLFSTRFGWIGISGSEVGLRRLVLPRPSANDTLRLLLDDSTEATHDDLKYLALAQRIRSYFSGQVVDFSNESLDIPRASPFQKSVWDTVRTVPYGETRSYRWIAKEIGRPDAARAVGQALAANPLPIIIPCHRVIGARGPGGYAGGLPLKKKLLELESSHARTRPAEKAAMPTV